MAYQPICITWPVVNLPPIPQHFLWWTRNISLCSKHCDRFLASQTGGAIQQVKRDPLRGHSHYM